MCLSAGLSAGLSGTLGLAEAAFDTSFEDSTLPHVGWLWLWLGVAGVDGVFEVALVEIVELSLVEVAGAEVVFASSVLSCCQKRSSCEEGDDRKLHL